MASFGGEADGERGGKVNKTSAGERVLWDNEGSAYCAGRVDVGASVRSPNQTSGATDVMAVQIVSSPLAPFQQKTLISLEYAHHEAVLDALDAESAFADAEVFDALV